MRTGKAPNSPQQRDVNAAECVQPWHDDIDLTPFFRSDASPIRLKNGLLSKFRPREAVEFVTDDRINSYARRWMYHGICAWVICPDVEIKTKYRNLAILKSSRFVHAAMIARTGISLDVAFIRARNLQSDLNSWDAATLFKAPSFRQFPSAFFLALGGVQAILQSGSLAELQKHVRNQREPAENVVAIMRQLHRNSVSRYGSTKPTRGLNWACAEVHKYGTPTTTNPNGKFTCSKSKLKTHWQKLKRSAAYLYAASFVDEGRLFDSLFDLTSDYLDPTDTVEGRQQFDAWLAYTVGIASSVLEPHGLLVEDWKQYEPPVPAARLLPPPG